MGVTNHVGVACYLDGLKEESESADVDARIDLIGLRVWPLHLSSVFINYPVIKNNVYLNYCKGVQSEL